MRIEAFLLCWNEIDIMRLVISHYQKFCDHITILDNYSTDGSDKLAREMGCEVKQFGNQFFDDHENRNIKNNIWKGNQSDWVICADFDELLCPAIQNITNEIGAAFRYYLEISHHTTIWKTIGWQIMSEDWPAHDLLEITTGYEFSNYAKSIIFNPQALTEINYGFGAHECKPEGHVVWSESPLYVLHYKHIGGVQRTIDRYRVLQKRLSKNNRKNGWGCHYNRSPASIRQEWNERMAKSKPLI
jgi:hypothetical protein